MAGKRQHYVPRFLQRGFLTQDRTEHDGEYTWWHFRGNPPELRPITHIGVKEYFYSRLSKDGKLTLDDVITAQERSVQSDLIAIRKRHVSETLDPSRMAHLVIHFVMRTAFVRSTFTRAAQQIINGIIAEIGKSDGMRAHLGVDDLILSAPLKRIVSEITTATKAAGIDMPPPLAERWIPYFLRERFDELMEDFEPLMSRIQDELISNLPTTIGGAHQKILMTGDHAARLASLSRLSWHVHAVTAAILPDCIAIAKGNSQTWAPLLLTENEDLEICILPIDESHLLVGTIDPTFEPDIEEINRASVRCSDQFFIAAHPMYALSASTGGRSAEIILASVESALNSLRSKSRPPSTTKQQTSPLSSEEVGDFNYVLSLPELNDSRQSTALTRIVTDTVRELSCAMPLETLDRITFAADYTATLVQLDRGDPALAPDLSEPREYGVPVAKCVSVIRHGQPKQHLVFDFSVAEGFLVESESAQRASLHTLVSMLAQIAHEARYIKPLADSSPGFPSSFIQLLHQGATLAPASYYTARVAAFADLSAGERQAEVFRDCLHAACAAMTMAHQEYYKVPDVDLLLNVGLQHIRHLMAHAAQWCGHQDGLKVLDADFEGSNSFGASLMREAVAPLGLGPWLGLLHQDLQDLYDPSQIFNADRVFSLVRHVERLLWIFHIFPWPMEDGGTYVTVVATDTDKTWLGTL